MAKDYLGNELDVGDRVVYVQLGYREFVKGYVLDITPKMLKIGHSMETRDPIKQYHDQVIKIG